jgi:hypothetical protein
MRKPVPIFEPRPSRRHETRNRKKLSPKRSTEDISSHQLSREAFSLIITFSGGAKHRVWEIKRHPPQRRPRRNRIKNATPPTIQSPFHANFALSADGAALGNSPCPAIQFRSAGKHGPNLVAPTLRANRFFRRNHRTAFSGRGQDFHDWRRTRN